MYAGDYRTYVDNSMPYSMNSTRCTLNSMRTNTTFRRVGSTLSYKYPYPICFSHPNSPFLVSVFCEVCEFGAVKEEVLKVLLQGGKLLCLAYYLVVMLFKCFS